MRILNAEDEKDLNQIITSRLRAEYYSVDYCYDGESVFDYLAGAESVSYTHLTLPTKLEV